MMDMWEFIESHPDVFRLLIADGTRVDRDYAYGFRSFILTGESGEVYHISHVECKLWGPWLEETLKARYAGLSIHQVLPERPAVARAMPESARKRGSVADLVAKQNAEMRSRWVSRMEQYLWGGREEIAASTAVAKRSLLVRLRRYMRLQRIRVWRGLTWPRREGLCRWKELWC